LNVTCTGSNDSVPTLCRNGTFINGTVCEGMREGQDVTYTEDMVHEHPSLM
jgi:hypothetical protein